jgi:hypothetical protein
MAPLKVIEEGLRCIALPSLTRPAVGPDDKPTEELVNWRTTLYVYSSIAHVRAILAGLVVLADIGNTPTARRPEGPDCGVGGRSAGKCYLDRPQTVRISGCDRRCPHRQAGTRDAYHSAHPLHLNCGT